MPAPRPVARGGLAVAAAIALPACAALCLLAGIVAAETTGGRLMALPPPPAITLAHAAGASSAAAVQRLIRAGADPNTPSSVPRGTFGNDTPVVVTPLEAAVMRGDLVMVQLLEQKGARRDAAMTTRLRALATSRGAADILEYLNR